MMRQAFYSAVRGAADVAWKGFQWANRKVPARSFHPAWSPEPLPKSHERTKPPLGFPRRTDSLCPVCTREVRDAIVAHVTQAPPHETTMLWVKIMSPAVQIGRP